jgi:cytochrome c biogenesis protein ResB
VGPGQILVDGKPIANPEAVYQGYVNQRRELANQLDRLRDERQDIVNQLSSEDRQLDAAVRTGLQKRLGTLEGRIDAVDQQLAVADQQVANAAAIPGAIVDHPPPPRQGPPEEVFALGGLFIVVAILPLSIAYARRIWRRSAAAVAALPGDILERFAQLDQAVESVAVEVERIGEGQRFITRVLSDQGGRAALGEGVARPIEVRARSDG